MKFLILAALLASQSLWAGIYEPHTLWNKRAIVTCFYSARSHLEGSNLISYAYTRKVHKFTPKSLSGQERAMVESTIQQHYTPQRTGIYFTGFKDCSQTPNPDLIVLEAKGRFLIFGPDFAGRGAIGEDGDLSILDDQLGFYQKTGKIVTVALNKIRPTTIVHEFGHIAGLRHEHIHPDARSDERCDKHLRSNGPDKVEGIFNTAIFASEYDRSSIMNYCYYFDERPNIDNPGTFVLSKTDIETLQEMYPIEE